MLAFLYVKFFGAMRHHGHFFILFIVCLWISEYYPDIELKSRFLCNLAGFCTKFRTGFITLILSAHLIAGIIACGTDWLYPFSESRRVAKFINDNKMNNMLMVGDRDYAASAVSCHLNRKIYYPRTDRFGTYIIYDEVWGYANVDAWAGKTDPQEVFEKVEELIEQKKEDILLILNYELTDISAYPVVKIREFNKSIVSSENFFLYLMSWDAYKHSRPGNDTQGGSNSPLPYSGKQPTPEG
jgi:hypothetical protein